MKGPALLLCIVLAAALVFAGCATERSVTVFAGSVSKPALEEAASVFERETGVKVYLNFGGSGALLSQMKLSRRGDLYLPASPDYMAMAIAGGLVDAGSEKRVAYLVPAILVPAGNPAGVRSLADLSRPGVRVAIADPQSVSVGLYAYEILEHAGLISEISRNMVTYGESYAKTVSLVSLGTVDAIIGWREFAQWNKNVEMVPLMPEEMPRLSYISGAIASFAMDSESARSFLDFLASARGQEIFGRWGYLITEAEASKISPGASIGGEYRLPPDYRPLVR
ncbi:MAG: molybdate ABC transporter substrate-binding protein [Chloroflexi bacterium]|nr:molybdate ABC transporter substrate-binding protein [Chloroflexota bacterium]